MDSEARSTWVLDAPPSPADVVLPYGAGPNRFGELRLPRTSGRHPLVVAFHGGFWKARYDLGHLSFACAALTDEGFATFSVEYPRTGQDGGGVPGTLEEAARALDFALGLPERFPVDGAKAVLLGHSAGGQLALWSAGAHRKPSPPLRGVVALAPVSDLLAGWEAALGDGAVEAFVGGAPSEVEGGYRLASPLQRLPLGIPQVLLHGAEDDTVPIAQSERYVAHARALGDPARLEVLAEAGHYELIDPRSHAWPKVVSAIASLVS